jgi:translocator protein
MARRARKKKVNWSVLLVSLIVVYAVALLGGIFSGNTNSVWYQTVKPAITPPNLVFPIVWNILFLLIALSIYFAWTSTKKKRVRRQIIILFGANLALNLAWSIFFFGLQRPGFAFIDLIVLWISILSLLIFTWKIEKRPKKSFYLLLPYFVWVTFAGILNYLIVF